MDEVGDEVQVSGSFEPLDVEEIQGEARPRTAIATRWRRNALGSVFLLAAAALFAINSELLQTLGRAYFVLIVGHGSAALFLPVFFIALHRWWGPAHPEHLSASEPLIACFLRMEAPHAVNSVRRTLLLSGVFSTLYMAQNYLVVLAYQFGSVTVTNALWQSSSLIVYALSIWILREKLLLLKVVAVVLGLLGVVLLSVSNDPGATGGHGLLGVLLALGSAAMTAVYAVLFKRFGEAKSGTLLLATLHMGLIGVWHVVFFWVGIPILHATGWEPWQWPSAQEWARVALSALIAFIVNALTMLTIVLTTPLLVSVGMALVVPASWIADSVSKPHFVIDALGISGICIVIVAFLLLNLAGIVHSKCCKGRLEWRPLPAE